MIDFNLGKQTKVFVKLDCKQICFGHSVGIRSAKDQASQRCCSTEAHSHLSLRINTTLFLCLFYWLQKCPTHSLHCEPKQQTREEMSSEHKHSTRGQSFWTLMPSALLGWSDTWALENINNSDFGNATFMSPINSVGSWLRAKTSQVIELFIQRHYLFLCF